MLAVAEATGLAFVKIATLQAGSGTRGVDKLVGEVPEEGAGGTEAHRLARLMAIASTIKPASVTAALETFADSALDAEAQRSAYLALYVEG